MTSAAYTFDLIPQSTQLPSRLLLRSTTSDTHILHTKDMTHLVIDLRSGQELGPGLQPNDIMVLKQEE